MSLFGEEKGTQIVPPYKGPLSTWEEWHSLGIGIYHSFHPRSVGVPKKLSNPESYRYNSDVDKEPHMAKKGYVVGEVLKYIGLLVFIILQ